MSQKWNLQDIRPSGSARKERRRPQSNTPTVERAPEGTSGNERIQIKNGNAKKRGHLIALVFVFLVIIAGIFASSALLRGAEVTVYPKHRDVTVQATFTAAKNATPGDLTYELLTLETEGEQQVTATGQEQVETQAEGEIVITKTTAGAQPLIKNTRFESPDGLIFKLFESVIVPGAVENDAGELVPGTISARVFAETTGEEYNLPPATFTVPGLESDEALFAAIRGESQAGFTGGFNGKRFIIDEGELETARQGLHTELRNILLEQVPGERPAGFVLYEPAISFTFESLPAVEYGEDLATIKEKAYLRVPLFEEAEFARYIAENTVAGFEGEEVRLEDPFTLTFSYLNGTTSLSDISQNQTLSFNLRGNTRVIWVFDAEQLRADLLNVTKNGLPTVLSGYPAIERAEAVIKPFWKQSFPTELTEIEVIEVIEETE